MIFLEHSIGGENDILARKLKKVSNIKEFNARRCGGISWDYIHTYTLMFQQLYR